MLNHIPPEGGTPNTEGGTTNRTCRLLLLCWVVGAMTFTGVSRAQIHNQERASGGTALPAAARAFLSSLNDQQRAIALRLFDDSQRLRWHYVPQEKRKGIPFFDMNDAQRTAAMNLVKTCLSRSGFQKAKLVMEQESVIRYLENGNPVRDPLRYFVTVFNEPTTTGTWGLSIEGHHLSLNFVMNGEQITCATPMFIGANPATVLDNGGVGLSTGTQILKTEEGLVEKLAASFTPDQAKTAVVALETPMDMKEGNKAQTPKLELVGISAAALSDDQKALLTAFCSTVFLNAPLAEPPIKRLKQEIDAVRFAWYGPIEPGKPYSCRVESPKFLILLYKAQSDPAGNPANHTHLLWRTPGGDFGVIPPA